MKKWDQVEHSEDTKSLIFPLIINSYNYFPSLLFLKLYDKCYEWKICSHQPSRAIFVEQSNDYLLSDFRALWSKNKLKEANFFIKQNFEPIRMFEP